MIVLWDIVQGRATSEVYNIIIQVNHLNRGRVDSRCIMRAIDVL